MKLIVVKVDLEAQVNKPKFKIGDLVFLNNLTFSNLAVRIIGVEKHSDGYYYELRHDKGVFIKKGLGSWKVGLSFVYPSYILRISFVYPS